MVAEIPKDSRQNTVVNRKHAAQLVVLPGNAQHIGQRSEQQDSFGFFDIQDNELMNRAGFLAVLADGMGGLAMGREASTTAVSSFISAYSAIGEAESIVDAILRALHSANEAVFSMAVGEGMAGEVGTTTVAVVVREGKLYWISAGDSRIYLCRDGQLNQLTIDHTYGLELADKAAQGLIPQEVADNHPERHALTSYLGVEKLMQIGANSQPIALEAGDRILLCSDGLYNTLSEPEIANCLADIPTKAAELLVSKVLDKEMPYQDNVTVAVLGYGITSAATVTNPQPKKKKSFWGILFIVVLAIGFIFTYQKYSVVTEKDENSVQSGEPTTITDSNKTNNFLNNEKQQK